MLKSDLRKLYLTKRSELNEIQFLQLNEQLVSQVILYIKDLPANQTIASFFPIAHKHEIQTILLHEQLVNFPFLHTLVFPRVESENNMCFYKIDSTSDIEISNWGIPEPKSQVKNLVKPQDLQIIFIPLLAFDKQGHRVGYGKGFYDQYLSKCSPNLIKIGLTLFDEISVIDDIEPTDVALDIIITPFEVRSMKLGVRS